MLYTFFKLNLTYGFFEFALGFKSFSGLGLAWAYILGPQPELVGPFTTLYPTIEAISQKIFQLPHLFYVMLLFLCASPIYLFISLNLWSYCLRYVKRRLAQKTLV